MPCGGGGTLREIDEDGNATDTTYAYKDVLFWPADGRAHRDVVVDGTPRGFLFELRD